MTNNVSEETLNKAKLNLETAQMPWSELERFFAGGTLLSVSAELDIVEVAHCMSIDDKAAIVGWLNDKKLGQISDDQAKSWCESNAELWTVIVRPWILVQDK
ncbi:DUF2288 domain-containing protein [Endozoicomonas sp. OPT23]|uniref:DUF2288 domain-containing protein n=1 Tax=Endozoicomonas sp. OPT23 TaxID=2072845 RepID=UPI00129B8956|nr:DUF2288 domain-containing protein [Endozoicomonas sp. OPT23]MRI31991.1 DUF2288 domain-containing protein [Endozoicomonas sp. OPT23]